MSNTTNTTPITLVNSDRAVSAVRSAVRNMGTWQSFVTDNGVTRDNVKDYASALAVLAFPKDAPVQKTDGKRTRFGNAVQAAGNGMRYVLTKNETDGDTDGDTDTDGDSDDSKPLNLLTRAGLSATLEEVTAAWTAAQK